MNIPSITSDQMRDIDRRMGEVYHIGLLQMMENAGRNLARLSREWMPGGELIGKHISVLAGSGGNGGGGLVAARHLHNWGAVPRVYLSKSRKLFAGVPKHQLDILLHMGVPVSNGNELSTIQESDLILDALIGYSLKGAPHGHSAKLIEAANLGRSYGVPVISLDIPSGLDATTGEVNQPCIKASATMTLALPKTGLYPPEAKKIVGDLFLADISIPRKLYQDIGLQVPLVFSGREILRIG